MTFLVKYLNRQIIDATRWIQMLKTHVLIHRLLLNCGDEFKDQLKRMQQWVAEDRNKDSRIKCLFSIRNWRDESGPDANELSGWTRSYAGYLEEYVATLDHIPRLDQMAAGSGGASAQPTELRTCDETELMEKLPRVQHLMRRLLECEATNQTLTRNEVVIAGTALLMKDSFKIYRLVNDGIIRLIDLFFEMTKLNAMKALDVYRKATSQGEALERVYRNANEWERFRETKFPQIENPPASFLQTMEEYAKSASSEGAAAQNGAQGRAAAPAQAPAAAGSPTAAAAAAAMAARGAAARARGAAARPAPAPAPAPAPTSPIDDLLGSLSVADSPAPPAPSAGGVVDLFAAPAGLPGPEPRADTVPAPVATGAAAAARLRTRSGSRTPSPRRKRAPGTPAGRPATAAPGTREGPPRTGPRCPRPGARRARTLSGRTPSGSRSPR